MSGRVCDRLEVSVSIDAVLNMTFNKLSKFRQNLAWILFEVPPGMLFVPHIFHTLQNQSIIVQFRHCYNLCFSVYLAKRFVEVNNEVRVENGPINLLFVSSE